MEVYKSPTCGCCSKWVEHVQKAGFTVRVTEVDDAALDGIKAKNGVPRTAQSCHTALVGGYVIDEDDVVDHIHRDVGVRPLECARSVVSGHDHDGARSRSVRLHRVGGPARAGCLRVTHGAQA